MYMKHSHGITFLLLGFFFLAQVIGLGLISIDATVGTSDVGTVEVVHPDTAIGERPKLEPNQSVFMIVLALLVGTALVFLLMKYRQFKLWKFWFFLSIFLTLFVAFSVVLSSGTAFLLALGLAIWRSLKPNIYIHNFTELFIYAGIALIFVPILNVTWVIVLMVLIALYDAYAVWKSGHMVKLAEFQAENKTFAGLYFGSKAVPVMKKTKKKKGKKSSSKKGKQVHAILGGGDVAFPLLFSGVVMESLLLEGASKLSAFSQSLWITLGSVLALTYLFFRGTSARYYPAIPFLLVGCLLGYALVLL